MSFDWINPFNKVADIVSEVVEDKDQRNRLMSALETLKEQTHQIALQTKTVAWVDAVHKMGRQISVYAQMGIYTYCKINDIEIDMEFIALISGPAGGYMLMKGKGK